MNFEHLKTVHGLLNLIQVLFGFASLFASSFIWHDTDTYIQFIYKGFGWQTLINAILLATWIFAILVFFANLFEKDVLGSLGKKRLLGCYVVCLALLIISAALESWYCDRSAGTHYHARFVAVTIFNWLLVISYIILIAVTALFA